MLEPAGIAHRVLRGQVVKSIRGDSGRDWQNEYAGSGTLALAANPAEPALGDDWHKLGTVTLPGCTSALTISYHWAGLGSRRQLSTAS